MKIKFQRTAVLVLSIIFLIAGCNSITTSEPVEKTTDMSEAATSSAPQTQTEAPETTTVEDELPEYTSFFADVEIHDIYINFEDGDWETIKATVQDEVYYSAEVTIDGERFFQVGVRTKGNSSLKLAEANGKERFPFHLKFDKYIDNQSFYGLDDLVLNNSTDDPSYLREYIAYEGFRQLGMDVPCTTFFRTYINGELHGFYIGVECVNSSFLDRAFGSHKNSLYKANVGATLETQMPLDEMEGEKGAPEDKSDLSDFIEALNATPTGEKGQLEEILDVDSVLKYFAVCAVVHDWDDYCGRFSQNYYLYESGGVFHIIPWDMNESFLQTQAYYRQSDGSKQDISTPITGKVSLSQRPLAEKLLSVPEYYNKYLSYCETLADWLDEVSSNQLSELKELIDESVKNDPTSYFSYESFSDQFLPDNLYGLAGFIKDRVNYLEKRIDELKSES